MNVRGSSSNNSPKYDFSNKVVLITGGTGALGRFITKAFLVSNVTTTISDLYY